MATSDSQENQKWFIDHVDSILQNFIDVHESDYDNYSASLHEADEELVKFRNTAWQVIAGLITVALGLAALRVIDNGLLVDTLAVLGALGIFATLGIDLLRRAVSPRIGKVDEAYNLTRLKLLYLQAWFQNTTLHLEPTLTQARLDLYYDLIRCTVASQYLIVLNSVIKFEAEMRLLKPGDALGLEMQRVTSYVDRGYNLYLTEAWA